MRLWNLSNLMGTNVWKRINFIWHTGIPGLWTQVLDAGLWTFDYRRWTLDSVLWALNARLWTCRLLTAKSWSRRGASYQPASKCDCLTINHMCLPCSPSRWVSPCVLYLLMIGLMVILLTFFGGGEYVFSNVRVAILINGCGIQGQNYGTLLQGSEMTAGFTTKIGFSVYNALG